MGRKKGEIISQNTKLYKNSFVKEFQILLNTFTYSQQMQTSAIIDQLHIQSKKVKG